MRPLEDYFHLMEAFVRYEGLIRASLYERRGSLTKTQVAALLSIESVPSMNMTTLSERLAISREHATRTVQPLVEQGYVQRTRDSKNKKVINISLAQAGRDFLVNDRHEIETEIASKVNVLSPEEVDALLAAACTSTELLDKVLSNTSAHKVQAEHLMQTERPRNTKPGL